MDELETNTYYVKYAKGTDHDLILRKLLRQLVDGFPTLEPTEVAHIFAEEANRIYQANPTIKRTENI